MPGAAPYPMVRQQPYAPQPFAPPSTPWQATPQQSSGPQTAPARVRGAMPDVLKTFTLPSPDALGVSTNLTSLPPPAPQAVDWNQIQARMERLRVLRYQKERIPGGMRVTILLPTNDPARGQPVQAQAESEAAAVQMALDAGEAWMQKR